MIQTQNEARTSLLKGVNVLADIVKTTLGPHGSTVILHTPEGKAYTTKDGVSVARKVFDNDMMVDAGIQLVREGTSKTAEVAGDGTTTSTILAQAIILRCMNHMNQGISPLFIKKGMEEAMSDVINLLKTKYSTSIGFQVKELVDIATLSANNDKEIGKIVADAFIEAGEEGLVLYDESPNEQTYTESIDGMQIDSQLVSPAFINNYRMQTAEYEAKSHNVAILLIDGIVKNLSELAPQVLSRTVSQQIPVVIVAHEFSNAVLKEMIQNNVRNNAQILPIKADGFGVGKTECLKDISALTGATIFDNCENARFDGLGACKKIIVSKFKTVIVKADTIQDTSKLQERVEALKSRISEEKEEFNRKKLKEKLAKLVGKMSIIHVGGITEAVAKEKYDRVEDAVYATRAAIEEGISIGGGMTYLNIVTDLMESSNKHNNIGYDIILDSLKEPFHQLCINCGKDLLEFVDIPDGCTGYNFLTEDYCDMVKEGIVDPTKVLRVALENAVAVASLIISTSGIITGE